MEIKSDLLIALVQAMMLLGEEMGEAKGPLREAELGIYQISILSKDHLAYCVLQDTWDSEPFTQRILEGIIQKHHAELVKLNLNYKINQENELRASIEKLLQTMKFPKDKIETIKPNVESFLIENNRICDTFFLADFDDGIIHTWEKRGGEAIIKILMEILSEIPFERQWVGFSQLMSPVVIDGTEKTHEAWFIYRLGLTDYCLMGRGYYKVETERTNLLRQLNKLSKEILHHIDSE